MSYMSQEHKAEIVAVIKPILKKYGVKASFRVRHHSGIVMTIKSGPIDFINNYNKIASQHPSQIFPFTPVKDSMSVNIYSYEKDFDGEALEFLKEVVPALHGPRYFDHSDPMTDYFHCSHYIYLQIGVPYETPYKLVV